MEGIMKDRMPVLFVGHGSPMNAIEDNAFASAWKELGRSLPRPEAILSVSAHWVTDGTRINDEEHPKTIYDMYGFPPELYRVKYDAPGSPETAREAIRLAGREVMADNSWGIDHGTWSVLHRMYPQADIPVCQLSIDSRASAEEHYRIGQALRSLRDSGVLIMGSGNVVHNLRRISWDMEGGYSWAYAFDDYILEKITHRQFGDVIDYRSAGESAEMAFPTTEHFFPLLYVLGASQPDDGIRILNHSCTMGALSMTSYVFG